MLSPAPPDRIVRVKILADPRIRAANLRWRSDIKEKFSAAADFFEREFNILLVAGEIQPWTLQESVSSTAELMTYLKKRIPLNDKDGSHDIVIAFTALPGRISAGHARVDEIGDCQAGLGNYLAISAIEPLRIGEPESAYGNWDVLTLIHELGHLFGAEHVNDRSSIMAVNFNPYTDFDRRNREIILRNKFCPFRKG
jgi:hypothetical protein